MGAMVVDVSQSPDPETLKAKVLEHIRGLRKNLNLTRQRMEQVERVSRVLSQEAMTDPLTKAWNKRVLTARMEDALAPVSLSAPSTSTTSSR